jgi:hypothetical protein
MATGRVTPAFGRQAASKAALGPARGDAAQPADGPLPWPSGQDGPGLGVIAALLDQPLLISAGVTVVHPKDRFDRADTALEIRHCCVQRTAVLAAASGGRQPLEGDPPQVVLRKLQRSRQVGQRGAVAGLLIAMLNFPQRGGREARSLGQFSLRQAASCHPVVDDRGDIGPVSQGSLPSAQSPVVLTAGYRILRAIDSALTSAIIAPLVSLSRSCLDNRAILAVIRSPLPSRPVPGHRGSLTAELPPEDDELLAVIEAEEFPEPQRRTRT